MRFYLESTNSKQSMTNKFYLRIVNFTANRQSDIANHIKKVQ